MTKQELITLINQELDGTNTAAESDRLRDEIHANAESRRLMEELKSLTGALEATRAVAPPSDLKPAIMRGIQQRKLKMFNVTGHGQASWFAWIFRKPSYVFASGLAVGIALILLYVNLFPLHPVEPADASGSMVWSPAALRAGETLDFGQFGLQGYIETRYGDNSGFVFMRFGTPGTKAELRYDPEQLTPNSIVRVADFQGTVAIAEGKVLAHGDRGSLTVLFAAKGRTRGTLDVSISAGGKLLYEGKIAIRPDGGR